MTRILLTACIVIALLSTTQAAEPFVFTAIPDQDESRLRSRFDKVAVFLSQQLAVEVRYIPVKSYAAAITSFRNNQVQLAWFGGLSGVQARRLVPGSMAIAQGFEDQFFETWFIAHASTGLTESQDFPMAIAGMNFSFGSKGSTSGRLMPEYHIRQYFGAAPDEVFKRVGFSGDHSRTISLVQSGAFQVGVVNFKVWQKEMTLGRIDPAKVSVIWRTPPYPDYQWTIRGDLDPSYGPGFTEKVRQTLIGMHDPDVLNSFPRKSFVPASNQDYELILDVAKSIGIID